MGEPATCSSSLCFIDKIWQRKNGVRRKDDLDGDDAYDDHGGLAQQDMAVSPPLPSGQKDASSPISMSTWHSNKNPAQDFEGALVVGHYCHDTLQLADGRDVEALGGSVSYMTNILDAFRLRTTVVSKVGSDFKYKDQVRPGYSPQVIEDAKTVHFVADLRSGPERVLTCRTLCDPIQATDIPRDHRFQLALAAGVAGEILPETLERMCDQSRHTVADVQALVRSIDPQSGAVALLALDQSPARGLLDRLSFIKASADEAAAINLKVMRQQTHVILTRGSQGCSIYYRDMEFYVPTFVVREVDPTGAGDSFLAGFAAGLSRNLSVEKAALLGNFCGSVAVSQVGVPQFNEGVRRVLSYYMNLPVDNSFDCFESFPSPEAAAASISHDQNIISSLLKL